MIDVVLQLIIFFLVTSQISSQVRTPLPLPEQPGAEDQPQTETGGIVVDLLADGSLRIDGESVSLDVFSAMLGSESGTVPSVLIRPERDAPAAHLNRLTRRLAEAGITTYRMAVTPPRGARP
jgi:biopolymer transport protein ExbD